MSFQHTKISAPAQACYATAVQIRNHIIDGGGFISRGKALCFLQLCDERERVGASETKEFVKWVWLISDEGRHVENYTIGRHTLEHVAGIVIVGEGEDPRTGNSWRFSNVKLEYT